MTSLCTWGDLLVVTGTQGRSLNPYDTSGTAPTRYVSDPMIKASCLVRFAKACCLFFFFGFCSQSISQLMIPGLD